MITQEAFYFDPDFRKTHIHPRDPKKPYCCRCQMNVDPAKAIAVTCNDETWMALEGHDRHDELRTNFNPQARDLVYNGYIGRDCRRAIAKGMAA
jgi:hypothetical protein